MVLKVRFRIVSKSRKFTVKKIDRPTQDVAFGDSKLLAYISPSTGPLGSVEFLSKPSPRLSSRGRRPRSRPVGSCPGLGGALARLARATGAAYLAGRSWISGSVSPLFCWLAATMLGWATTGWAVLEATTNASTTHFQAGRMNAPKIRACNALVMSMAHAGRPRRIGIHKEL